MYEQALELFKAGKAWSIGPLVQAGESGAAAGKRYEQLVLDLYWKAKNLPATVAVANTGLMYCLTNARKAAEPSLADALFNSAKQIAYNLASFCWPGWDEPGIAITSAEIQSGASAAKLNLTLAQQLKRPPLGMSQAHWMLGAFAMAQSQFSEAGKAFAEAMTLADKAENKEHFLMNQGYRALARLGARDKEAGAEVERVVAALQAMDNDDARGFASQLKVARKVFNL